MPKTFNLTRIYQLLIVVLTLLLLWKWNCGSHCPEIQETTRIDTVWKITADSSGWSKPAPVAVRPGNIPTRVILMPQDGRIITDTVWMPVDTGAILADYYSFRDYDTSYLFTEGSIRVQNSVSQNAIQNQRVLPTFHIPEIIKTITQAEKKKRKFYFGIDGYGGPAIPLFGAGASILYEDRKDRMYEVGPVIFKDQPLMWKAGAKFKISFR